MRPLLLLLVCGCLSPVAMAAGQPPDALTVRLVVADALARAPELAGQRARLEGERRAAPEAGRLPNPSLTWMGEGLRRNPPTVLQPDHGIFTTLSIPLGPQCASARALASAAIDVTAGTLASRQEALTLEMVDLFVQALSVERMRQVLVEQQDGLAEIIRVQQRRVDEGVATVGDLRRLQAESARVSLAAARLGAEGRRLRLALCVWTSRPDCEALPLAWPADLEAVRPDPVLLDEVVERRPAVQAARATADEARRAADVAEASVWPFLQVTGGYRRTQFLNTGLAGVSIGVPLFDRRRLERARAAATVDAATFDLAQVRREARLEVMQTSGLSAELTEQARLQDQALIAPALAARLAARSAYREGEVDLLRLLDAERLVSDVRLDAATLDVEALGAALRARVLLGLPLP
jgi:outer membrane protein, heavy metal efflux system